MKALISGGVRPHGSVRVSGAKNAGTRLLAAALLSDDQVELSNFPTKLVDVGHKIRFIERVGGVIGVIHEEDRLIVNGSKYGDIATDDYDVPIRTTYLLVAAQILRHGFARIPYPGGCKIGARGYDMHIMVWQQLGCEVVEREAFIEIIGKSFVGGEIHFPISTVGGTENALLCASVARGTTQIFNAYITPEIDDLIELLRRMGADIEVRGNSRIVVHGKSSLAGARMSVMPDRIEALTWIVYAILARGTVLIENVPFNALEVPLLYLKSAGIDLLTNSNSAYVHPDVVRAEGVQPFEVPCGAHPGVISDMQPFYVMLGLAGAGISRIFDYRYPERIGYCEELAKFCQPGAIKGEFGKITVQGPASFKPAEAWSTDLRGSMAVILAGLLAEGKSVVHDAHMALRGYNGLAEKLASLGVKLDVFADEDVRDLRVAAA